MTMQQETRFMCDRCKYPENVALNDQPAMERGKAPGGWVTMYLHTATSAALHLCPKCAPKFEAFLHPEAAP